jgi:hypothetical protein
MSATRSELERVDEPTAPARVGVPPGKQPPLEVLVSVIERNAGHQIRISIVRFLGRNAAWLCIAEWWRNAFKAGDDWRQARRAPLILASEMPLVIEATERAIERARELNWEIR